jgi:hypothetical protein
MFNFNFGKKKPDKKQIILISVILSGIVATLSQCTGVSPERLWDLLDEAQRSLFPQTIINDILLQDPAVVGRRTERDVDKAIREYERLTGDTNTPRVPLPRLIEKAPDEALCYSDECKKLGGEMRLCAPWVDSCKEEDVK